MTLWWRTRRLTSKVRTLRQRGARRCTMAGWRGRRLRRHCWRFAQGGSAPIFSRAIASKRWLRDHASSPIRRSTTVAMPTWAGCRSCPSRSPKPELGQRRADEPGHDGQAEDRRERCDRAELEWPHGDYAGAGSSGTSERLCDRAPGLWAHRGRHGRQWFPRRSGRGFQCVLAADFEADAFGLRVRRRRRQMASTTCA
jgi:hypothetical protein